MTGRVPVLSEIVCKAGQAEDVEQSGQIAGRRAEALQRMLPQHALSCSI